MSEAADAPLRRARESRLVPAGAPLVVMLSGGADSVCLLEVALRLGASVNALHVNYGLRAGAGADERHCRELCERLGTPLALERARLPGAGNLQAEARDARYAAAEALGRRLGGDHAAAHTASDQAETILYRLATSPGRRALTGMAPRRGRLVRPLLECSRAETRAYCEARGLGWREDPSNADPRFARARVRAEVMPVLEGLSPAAERTIAETARQLREEQEVLDAAADEALGGQDVRVARLEELRALPPPLARVALRRLAEAASGGAVSLPAARAREVLELGCGGSSTLDVGGGLRATVEYGTVRFGRPEPQEALEEVALPIPGTARLGSWEVEARVLSPAGGNAAAGDPGEPVLDADALGAEGLLRGWRYGDRMRPGGVGGSKSLQDLFTDRKVPRALRRSLPILEVAGEIAWVAGVAVGERFLPRSRPGAVVSLSARRTGGRTLALDA